MLLTAGSPLAAQAPWTGGLGVVFASATRTMDDYFDARMIRWPLSMLDMDVPVDGARLLFGIARDAAFDDAIAGGDGQAVDGLGGWLRVDVWRSDVDTWMRASAALTRDMVRSDG